jgi:hypothetical protein
MTAKRLRACRGGESKSLRKEGAPPRFPSTSSRLEPAGRQTSPDEDARRLDLVRSALKQGNVDTGARYRRIFELIPVAV